MLIRVQQVKIIATQQCICQQRAAEATVLINSINLSLVSLCIAVWVVNIPLVIYSDRGSNTAISTRCSSVNKPLHTIWSYDNIALNNQQISILLYRPSLRNLKHKQIVWRRMVSYIR